MNNEDERTIEEEYEEYYNEENYVRVKNPPHGVRHYDNIKTYRQQIHAPYLHDDPYEKYLK